MKGGAMNIVLGLFMLLILGVLMSIFQIGADDMANNTTSDVAKVAANLIPAALVIGALYLVFNLVGSAFRGNTQTM